MKKTLVFSLLLSVLAGLTAPALQAQVAEKNLTLNLLFGYRAVDTKGAYDKYKEDFNLEKGVRLFNFQLSYIAPENLKKLFDRVDLSVRNFGGDPFESFSFTAQKYGLYRFQYERKKSTYFYADPRMIGSQTYFDMKQFDFDRVSDRATLNATVAKPLDVFFDFNRYSKTGNSTTSLDLNRNEFEFEKPVSEKLFEYAVGLNLHMERYGLVLEQRRQEFENANSYFLAGGYTDGGAGAIYPSAVSYFSLAQPYDSKTDITSLRLNARPFDNLILRGSARWSGQDTSLSYAENAQGIDYLGRAYLDNFQGKSSFTRDIALYDFDLTYFLSRKLAIVGAVRYNTFAQEGLFKTGAAEEITALDFKTLGLEAGLQYLPSSRLALTVGYRNETRTMGESEVVEEGPEIGQETVRQGFFGNLKWNLKALKLTLDYQRSDYDDPFTLISPTQFDRFRATIRTQIKNFTLSAGFLSSKIRNEIDGGLNFRAIYAEDDFSDLWKSSNTQFNLRLGYHTGKIDFGIGYAAINFKQDSQRQIAYNPGWTGPGGTFPWTIAYEGKSNLVDAAFSWTLDPAWRFGATVNSYQNKGFWPIDRMIFKVYLEHTFGGGFLGQAGYRYINFEEKDSNVNYTAGILELSCGYRW